MRSVPRRLVRNGMQPRALRLRPPRRPSLRMTEHDLSSCCPGSQNRDPSTPLRTGSGAPASFQGNRSYVMHVSRAAIAIAPALSSRMRRLEIVITCLPRPPLGAPGRCVFDGSSHTSCLSRMDQTSVVPPSRSDRYRMCLAPAWPRHSVL